MKSKILIIMLILSIFIFTVGNISAENISCNGTDDILDYSEVPQDEIIDSSINDGEILSDSSSSSKTITIVADKTNPNQVLKPTVQPQLDLANPGDTIILKGDFVHCHFTVNKPLTIISQTGTYLDACPHHTHEGVSEHGVFYITSGGSGSVIGGFNFNNNDKAETPFSFLIDGASDVMINDCNINFISKGEDYISGITIQNSNGITLSNLVLNNTINGIRIINSTNINIVNCKILNTQNSGISVNGDSSNINILNNQISDNSLCGINLETVNYITINNNLIQNNGLKNDDTGCGIYVNSNITKLIVKGNIFLSNGLHAIMYDYRTRNLNNDEGADQLTIIDNNYFEGHKSMILHHRVYVENPQGDLKYDSENDVYGDVGEGTYIESKSYVYMIHAFIYNDIPCGFTYYKTTIPWSLNGPGNNGKYDFNLKLSNINQIKNGVYQISIVDSKGNVATDFNDFYLTFYLNEYYTINPRQSDIYKQVLIKNGVATADFRDIFSSFATSGNIITVAFPGLSEYVKNNVLMTFNVKDSDIPINPATSLSSSKLTTYPLSDSYLSAKLVDSKGRPISGQTIAFKLNGHDYSAKTDSNGVAKVKVSLSSKKTYKATITYFGNDDYKASSISSTVVIKTGSKKSKIKAPNLKIKKNKKKTYKLKLTTSSGKALKNQKIIVKLNGKTYTLKTNKKGIAKISIKLKKIKKYKISMKFLGNANYKAVSLTKTINVVKK